MKSHQLRDGVEDLGKVCTLEDPEHDGTEGVAHDWAQVGVHRHLERNWSHRRTMPCVETHPAQEPLAVRDIVSSEHPACWPGINQIDSEARDDSNSYPGQEHYEGVQIEVALAVALSIIVRPDDGQHAQTLGEEHHRTCTGNVNTGKVWLVWDLRTCEPCPRSNHQTPSPAVSWCPPQSDPPCWLQRTCEYKVSSETPPDGDIDWTSSPASPRASSPSTVQMLPVCGLLRATPPTPVPGLLAVSPSWHKYFKQKKIMWRFTPEGTELGFCISSTMIWIAILP